MVRLNVDVGELPDEPDALYDWAQIVHVACGGHAGDDASMRRALTLCGARGVIAGAHPSYPDREGFGRRAMSLQPGALRESVAAQCARLGDLARALGTPLRFVKAHGALYHAANVDLDTAVAVVRGALEALGPGLTLVGPAGGRLAEAAAASGVTLAREGFADRAMRPDGTLAPRTEPGALLTSPGEAASQARRLARSGEVDTVCVHGDTPGAVAIARAVREALDALAGG